MLRIHCCREWLLMVMAVVVAMLGSAAPAQDLVAAVEDDEAALRANHVPMTEATLDRMLFGSGGAAQFRRRLELCLTSRVTEIRKICALTVAQEGKLLLAGRGDIKRFFDRVQDAKKKIHHGSIDRVGLEAILHGFQRQTLDPRREFFDASSLLSKSLKNALSPEQFDRFQQVTHERAVSHHRATVSWVVGVMDTTLRLTSAQHRRLEQLLQKETRPPRRFGEYDYYGVMFQVSRLPEGSLRPIFDDYQWGKLSLQLAEAVRLERTLKDEGFVPDDQVADAATSRRNQPLPEFAEPRS
jgi:hypothetical protein